MSILDTEFQYYPSNVYITKALGTIKLRDLLNSIKTPKENIKEVFLKLQKATEDGDVELKKKLKSEKLYYFTPSVKTNCKGRTYDDIVEYNELMVVEFDKVEFAEDLKHYLFDTLKSVVAGFTSPSKTGCKFIIKIPKPKNAEDYKAYFCGLANYLDKIEGFDTANFNPLLPLFLSWDPDILIRENPSTWTRRGDKINAFKPLSQGEMPKVKIKPGEREKEYIVNKIKKMFSNIVDNGHGQVRSYSLVTGGYACAGFMNSYEAECLLEQCIEDTPYLRKDIKGYKKTAMKFLQQGLTSPIELTENEKNKFR